jgi:hypothetical protein
MNMKTNVATVELTDDELAAVLAGRKAVVYVAEPPIKSKAKSKAKKAGREHQSLDTSAMPTIDGEIERGSLVEYIGKHTGTAKAYFVTRVMDDKFNPGTKCFKLDGFLFANESLCRKIG